MSEISIPNRLKIASYAAQLQNYERHPPKVLGPSDCQILEDLLQNISSIPCITPAIEEKFSLRALLQIVVGDYPRVKHEYRFPDPFPDKANAVLEKYEAINWGASEEDEKDATSPTDSARKSQAEAAFYKARARSPSPTKKSPPLIPNADHPIFGTDGIMRNIMISSSGVRSYCIDTRYPVRPSNVVGHNGLSVGDWWPMQLCALRDGAHGARISGIAGSKANGAFSIVVSGTYDHLDADRGNTLYYSGSQALENKDPEVPIISTYTEAMRLSFQLRRAIRVLRCWRSSSRYSPSKGIRYDGLYTITGEETMFNAHGGAYIRFHLERNAGQPDMVLTRPTNREKRLCERVRAGY